MSTRSVRALREDDSSVELLFAPGNAGTASIGRNVPVAVGDVAALVALAVAEEVRLVVVGPELPLTLGLVDALAAVSIPAFGPSKAAAQLEGSKVFMKRLRGARWLAHRRLSRLHRRGARRSSPATRGIVRWS